MATPCSGTSNTFPRLTCSRTLLAAPCRSCSYTAPERRTASEMFVLKHFIRLSRSKFRANITTLPQYWIYWVWRRQHVPPELRVVPHEFHPAVLHAGERLEG